ncbi:baseplate J/gp47 family protein [Paenibacillus sp. FA6]|uniref:baseplate J/gp47 family protein n=1 Tax=Paenibacillus sp. FA6 TaxID=3413029 RepID=UPI003F655769
MLDMTYEDLMQQKLNGIDNKLDKRVGSIVFNAIAANSVEMVQALVALKGILLETFADTMSRENLIKRAAERGLKPYEATKAQIKGVFNINVGLADRFSLDDLNYIVIEKIAEHEYMLECETSGNIGNLYLGALTPIDYINGLTGAELTEILIPGEDEEDTEVFRARYFNTFESQAFGGNRADYKEKVGALQGVGGVKVYRAWNGGGTVKLVIIDSRFQKPSPTLIETLQEEVDPVGQQGDGLGIAPIDHTVTVFGVTEDTIDIETTITYQSGWDWAAIEPNVQTVIDTYFTELSEEWAESDAIVVRISQIETRFLGMPGIIDIANTKLNGIQQNAVLDNDAIPIRGVVVG